MGRRKPRKRVPVSKLAEFADNPAAFRKTRGRVRDPKAAAAGVQAHKNRVRSRNNGSRLLTTIALAAIIAIVLIAILR